MVRPGRALFVLAALLLSGACSGAARPHAQPSVAAAIALPARRAVDERQLRALRAQVKRLARQRDRALAELATERARRQLLEARIAASVRPVAASTPAASGPQIFTTLTTSQQP